MKIANPIYDIVFKFLMEDNQSAKIFISTVTGLNIISLETLPQELSIIIDKPSSLGIDLSINRIDFTAKILNEDGQERVIIIELQKTRFISETMRFRRYIGKQYMNSKFSQDYLTKGGSEFQLGLPIFPIFILGESYDELQNSSVTLIKLVSLDRYANKELKNDIYVKSLFHEGIIINIAALGKERRDELEIMLSIFDQNNTDKNKHVMNIVETEFPTKLRPLLRRLQIASKDVVLREVMTVEDEFLLELKEMDDRANVQRKLKEVAIKEKEEAQRQNEEAQRQNEKAQRRNEEAQRRNEEAQRQNKEAQRQNKEAQRQNKEAQRQNKEAQRQNEEAQKLKELALKSLKDSIKLLVKSNVSPETIASTLNITIDMVNSFIKE